MSKANSANTESLSTSKKIDQVHICTQTAICAHILAHVNIGACIYILAYALRDPYLLITYNTVICQQIFSKFNRIYEKEIIRDIKEIWFETIPKIFNIIKLELNAKLRSLYEESVTCTSEGITIIILIVNHLHACIWYVF